MPYLLSRMESMADHVPSIVNYLGMMAASCELYVYTIRRNLN